MKQRKYATLCKGLAELASGHRIPMAAAGLSYFLMLSVFPLLICLYSMLGGLFPQRGEILRFLRGLLPEEALQIVLDYLGYVSSHLSRSMLILAVTAMVSSSSAAFRIIDREMGALWGRRQFSGVVSWAFSLCFSMIFLAAVYLSVLLVVSGKWFLEFADRHIMFMNLSDSWRWWRFVLLFLLLLALLSGVYKLTSPRRRTLRLLPGAALASGALVAVSIVFSAFIGVSTRYPLIYGSLASVFVMMFWLYICGEILFLGGACNVVLNGCEKQPEHLN